MALVNPQIAMSYRPTVEYQPRNALAEYAQIQNIIGGQRQAEVAEMQLDQLRQDRDALRQIQAAIVEKGGPPDLGAAADAMIRSGRPQYIQQGLTIRDTLRKQKLLEDYEREYSPSAAAPSAVPAAAAPTTAAAAAAPAEGAANALAPAAAAAPTTVNAMRAAAQPDVNALMTQYRRAAAAGSPDAPAILKQIEAALRGDQNRPVAVSPGQVVFDPRTGQQVFAAPTAPERPVTVRPGEVVVNPQTGAAIFTAPANVALSDRFVPVGNLVFDRETQQYIAPTEAQRLQQQAPRAPVAVLQNGRPVYVTPEQAVGQTPFSPASVQVLGMGPQRETREPAARPPTGYRFTPTGDLEPIPGGPASPGLSPRDIQKREAAFPQATQSVNGFQTKSEQFIAELERLRDDPGLNQITGPIYGRTPSVSREGSRAQALYDKIFAKGGFQALQDMREASKTGGALGNVSNEEGRRLERSIVGGLDRTQNLADVQQGINDLIAEIRVSQARVREAYDLTYEYRSQRGGAGGAGGAGAGGRQLSPQDRQALDWANSNPRDPRAAQIKARLGVQ